MSKNKHPYSQKHLQALASNGPSGSEGEAECQQETKETPLSRWLAPLINLASKLPSFSAVLCAEPDSQVLTQLSEANVSAQVGNIVKTDVITNAWAEANAGEKGRKKVYVHGWVYDLESGRLRDLGCSQGPEGFVGERFVGGQKALA